MNIIAKFAKDESGATAIEYGLIAALIAVAIIAAAGLLGTRLGDLFNGIKDAINVPAATP
ncbi:Flp family type IVb pilin [Paradevosia shaoguanensis]|uniref:Flp family type IVb pilin n=1 Tax=Paradevosia shaoguanensis TaxID=1335043 RepID=UPI000455BAE1|nr:Flp family type IVb pilin [Paradevosia shaoguanensis]CDP50620.1 Flp pilus assembly protein, pilin Flp [Devosia sp. DBB001]